MKTKLFSAIFILLIFVSAIPAQWVAQNSNTFIPYPRFFGIHFINSTTGWTVGDEGIVRKTTNGGVNWTAQSIATDFLYGVFFVSASTGWAVGQTGIFITTDGGSGWTRQDIFGTLSVTFVNSTTGWVCGNGGYISRTTNAGTNWTAQTSNTSSNLQSIFFINSNTGWTAGWNGSILKTTNSGTNWISLSSGTVTRLNGISFSDANNGRVVGDSGKIRATIDGGASWFAQTSGVLPNKSINSVFFRPGTSIGWAAGSSSTLIGTTNNGAAWISQSSPVSQGFFSVYFPVNSNGYVVGGNGTIIATTTGGYNLSAPTNLTAVAVSASQINLNWTDNSDVEERFIIERSLSGVFWSAIDSVNANTTSYNNTGLFSDTRYYYRVFARTPFGNTGNTNEVNLYTLLVTLTLISPSNNSTNVSVTPALSWGAMGGVTNYHLQVSLNDINFNTNNIIFNDSTLTSASQIIPSGYLGEVQTYYWRVRSKNSHTSSLFTSPFVFTTAQYPGPNPCEDFSNSMFPPPTMFGEYSGTLYWTRQTPSAYAIGNGSARFNSWSAVQGTSQNLATYLFNPVSTNSYLTFDHAYQPWSGGNVDSLIVLSSTNGGGSYSALASMWGGLGAAAGPLNTVNTGGGQFTPNGSQWASKIFLLPAGTNRIKFKGVSGYGNDIWLDNVCIQFLPPPVSSVNLAVLPQGFFRTPPPQTIRDTVSIYLRRTDFPNISVDSAISYLMTSAAANSPFTKAVSGTYYIVVKHRNSIETWSKAGGEVFNRGNIFTYSFIFFQSQAYNNNLAQIDPNPFFGMYGGDVNQDYSIDLSDLAAIDNAVYNFASGYIVTDLNGDNIADLSDYSIADNNAYNFVSRQAPPGTDPVTPMSVQDNNNKTFKNNEERQKYLLTEKLMNKQKLKKDESKTQIEFIKVLKEIRKNRMNRVTR